MEGAKGIHMQERGKEGRKKAPNVPYTASKSHRND
jgi:hypothetical protein